MAALSTWRRMKKVLGLGNSQNKHKSKRQRHLRLESLEVRHMLSVSPGPEYDEDGTIFFWVTEHNSPIDHAMAFTVGQHELELSAGENGVNQGSIPVRAGETLWYTDIGIDIRGGDKTSGQFRVEEGDDLSYDDLVVTYVFVATETGDTWQQPQNMAGGEQLHVLQQTDALSRTTLYAYDAEGHLVQKTLPGSALYSYTYDDSGRLISETDPYGMTTRYTYNAAGNLIRKTEMASAAVPEPVGHWLDSAKTYNNSTSNLGNPNALNFNGEIAITAWVKPDSIGTQFHSILNHGSASSREVFLRIYNGNYEIGVWNGGATSFKAVAPVPAEDIGQWVHLVGTYDGTHWNLYRNGVLLASTASAVGAIPVAGNWHIGSDAWNSRYFNGELRDINIYSESLNADQVAFLYDDSNRRTTTYTYDASGRMTSTTDPMGNKTSYTYNAAGQKLTETNALGNTTRYGYNAAGQLIREESPLGLVTLHTYDAAGNRLSTTQTDTSIVPDPVGHWLDSAKAYNNSTSNLGNPSNLNFSGEITISAWVKPDSIANQFNNIIGHGSANNSEVFLRIYNGNYEIGAWNGGATSFKAVAPVPAEDVGRWVHLVGTYDGTHWNLYRNGELLASVAASVGAVTVSGDWNIGSANGNSRYFTGELRDINIYNESLTASQVAALYDPANSRTTTWTYDALGRKTSETNPLGRTTYYTYDAVGNLIEEAQANFSTIPVPVGHWLDSAKTYNNSTSNLGNPGKLNFSGEITISAWLKANSIGNSFHSIIGHGATTTSEVFLRIYNGNYEIGVWNGGATSFKAVAPVPAEDIGQWVHLAGTYDGTHWNLYRNGELLASVASTVGAIPVAANWYIGSCSGNSRYFNGELRDINIYNESLDADQIAFLYGHFNPDATTYVYDAAGQLLSVTDTLNRVTSYTYDQRGNIASVTGIGGATRYYLYDLCDRLVETIDINGLITQFVYDAFGNRTAEIRLNTGREEVARYEYTYDANGNLLTANDASLQYTNLYDKLNRRTSQTLAEDSLTTVVTYEYDVDGNKTRTAADNNTIVEYTCSGFGEITSLRRTNASGTQQVNFRYNANGTLLEIVPFENGLPSAVITDTAYVYGELSRIITAITAVDEMEAIGNILYFIGNGATPPTNASPVAVNDTFAINSDAAVSLNVLANDYDPDGDAIMLVGSAWTSALGVEIARQLDNTLRYNPTDVLANMAPGQTRQDTFTYTITDSRGATDTATVTVTITKPVVEIGPPTAVNDVVQTLHTDAVTVDVLANDFAADSGAVQLLSFDTRSGLGVTLTRTWDGRIVYDPAQITAWQSLTPGEIMLDTFTYTILDAHGKQASASVYINVLRGEDDDTPPGPDHPITDTWTYTLSENDELILAFSNSLATHFPASIRDTLRFSLAEASSNATATVYFNGALIYRPNPSFHGTDTLTVAVTHPDTTIAYYALSLTITPANRPPVAVNDTYTTDHKTAITINPTTNDSDPENDTITLTSFDLTTRLGIPLTLDTAGNILYDPTQVTALQSLTPGSTLTDSFTYTITDTANLTSTATVHITVTRANTPPSAVNLSYSINTADPLLISLFHPTIESDPGDYATLTGPTTFTSTLGATLTRHSDLTLQYDPSTLFYSIEPGESVADTFTYTIVDRYGATSSATISVTLTAPVPNVSENNHGPIAGSLTIRGKANEALHGNLLWFTHDADNDPLRLVGVDTAGLLGSLSYKPDGSYIYSPDGMFDDLKPGESALEQFDYTIADSSGERATGTISIKIEYAAPEMQVSAGGDNFESGQTYIYQYDSGFAAERLFFIYNSGNSPLELDLSGLYSPDMPAQFEILQFPDEVVLPERITTLKIRFDGSADVSFPVEIGTNIIDWTNDEPENFVFRFEYREIADPNSRRVEIPDLSISGAAAGTNTGTSAEIVGTVNKAFTGGTVAVQFSNDRNAIIASETIDTNGDTFACDISGSYTAGEYSQTIYYRTVTTIGNEVTAGPWQSYSFYLAPNPLDGEIRVEGMQLTSIRPAGNNVGQEDVPWIDNSRLEPYIAGRVCGDFLSQTIAVQFVHSLDANADVETVSVDHSNRSFCYDPWENDPEFSLFGTVYYRLVIDNVPQAWTSYTLTYPLLEEEFTLNFENTIATQNSIHYVTGGMLEVSSLDAIFRENENDTSRGKLLAVRWDTNGDGICDSVSKHYVGTELFYPGQLESDTIQQIQARPYYWNEKSQVWVPGNVVTTPSFVVVPTYVASIGVTTVTGSDSFARHAIAGTVATHNASRISNVKIAIDWDEDGVADDYAYTDSEGKFTCVIPPGHVEQNVRRTYRAAVCMGDFTTAGTYCWKAAELTYSLSLLTLQIGNGTIEQTDAAVIPRFEGKLPEADSYEGFVVQFALAVNDIPTGFSYVNPDGTYSYTLWDADYEGWLYYRVGKWSNLLQDYVYGSYWSNTWVTSALSSMSIAEIRLARPYQGVDDMTENPTVVGCIAGTDNLANRKIGIDTDLDGQADEFTYTDSKGNFSYTFTGAEDGRYVAALFCVMHNNQVSLEKETNENGNGKRYTVDINETPRFVEGEWDYFEFLYFLTNPDIRSVSLLSDTGTSSYGGVTAVPIFQGELDLQDCGGIVVEFYTRDSGGNRQLLGVTDVDSDGKFQWAGTCLPENERTTVFARALRYDFSQETWIAGNEVSISVTYDPSEVLPASFYTANGTILRWVSPEGYTDNRYVTEVPHLEGAVKHNGIAALVEVEFRAVVSGQQTPIPLGTTGIDRYGNFSFYAEKMPAGDVTIEFRILETSWNDSSNIERGEWHCWDVRLVAGNALTPQIIPQTLRVVNHLESNRVLAFTDLPYIAGRVHISGLEMQSLADVQLEYSYGYESGIASVNDDGTFLFEISNPSTYSNFLTVRPVFYDSDTNTTSYGEWCELQFQWEREPAPLISSQYAYQFGVSKIELLQDTGTSNTDGITDWPEIRVSTFKPEMADSLKLEWDINGDGKADGDTTSGSRYSDILLRGLSFGANTVYVRAAYTDGNTTLQSLWSPISFVYYGHEYVDGGGYNSLTESEAIGLYSGWAEEAIRISNSVQEIRNQSATDLKNAVESAELMYLLQSMNQSSKYSTDASLAYLQYQYALSGELDYYNAMMQLAQNTLDSALLSFSGDTTSFQFQDFQWGELPEDYLFVFPSDTATPPAYPAADYAQPDLDRDLLYLYELELAKIAQQEKNAEAYRAYLASLETQQQTKAENDAVAYDAYNAAVAEARARSAEAEYEAWQRFHLYYLMAEADEYFSKERDAIEAAYSEAIERYNQIEAGISSAIGWSASTPEESLEVNRRHWEVLRKFRLLDAELLKKHDDDVAANTLEHSRLLAQYNDTLSPILLEIEYELQLELNQLWYELQYALAENQRDYEIELAKIEQTQMLAHYAAEAELWVDEAEACEEAVRRFYSSSTLSSDAPEIVYELALAESRTDYIKTVAEAYEVWAQGEQQALYTEKESSAIAYYAMLTGDSQGVLYREKLLEDAKITAKHEEKLAIDRADYQRTLDLHEYSYVLTTINTEAVFTAILYALDQYDTATIYDILHYKLVTSGSEQESIDADIENKIATEIRFMRYAEMQYLYGYVQSEYGTVTPSSEFYEIKLGLARHMQNEAEIAYAYNKAVVNAGYAADEAILLAEKEFDLACSELQYQYDLAVAEYKKERQDAIIACGSVYDAAFLTAEHAMMDTSAEAWKDCQIDIAQNYLDAVEQWQNSADTAWGNYQHALAEANLTWVTETQNSLLEYTLQENSIYYAAYGTEYAAADAWSSSVAAAEYAYDRSLAEAVRDFEIASMEEWYRYRQAETLAKKEDSLQICERKYEYDTTAVDIQVESIIKRHAASVEHAWQRTEIRILNALHRTTSLFSDEPVNLEYLKTTLEIIAEDDFQKSLNRITNNTWYDVHEDTVYSGYCGDCNNPYPGYYDMVCIHWQSSLGDNYETTKTLDDAAIAYYEAIYDLSTDFTEAMKNAEIVYGHAVADADMAYSEALAVSDYNVSVALQPHYTTWQTNDFEANWKYDKTAAKADQDYEITLYEDHWNETQADLASSRTPLNILREAAAVADLAYVREAWERSDAYMNAAYTAELAQLQADLANQSAYDHHMAVQDYTLALSFAALENSREKSVVTAIATREMELQNAELLLDTQEQVADIRYNSQVAYAMQIANARYLDALAGYEEARLTTICWTGDTRDEGLESQIIAGAFAQFEAEKYSIRQEYFVSLGEAQIARVTQLGDNGIAYAEKLLEIYTVATTAINTAELAYTNARNTVYTTNTAVTSEALKQYQIATEQSARAYSAAMDTANVAYAADYQFEIDYEQALLTAELNYLIATGQADANVLNAGITNNSTSQEIYAAAYADARVAWMQTMKQPTIAYHVGILTADLAANHQYAITSAAENVALWTHYMEYVLATAEAEKQLAIMDTATANAYDLAEVLAENTWYLETDRLEYNRLIELWKIEKTRAIEVATLEDQYRRINQSVPYAHGQSIEAAATEKIEKIDASWAKSQIAIDDTYIAAMTKAVKAESKACDEAEEAYYGRIRSAFEVQQASNDVTYEDFDPQYETLESGYIESVTTAAGAYYDTFFTVMTTRSVSDSLPDSPYTDGLRWLWSTIADAWHTLRETYLDNLWSLQDNYDSPTDALFALLAEDDELLETLTTPDPENENPFIAYQAAMLQAEAKHIVFTTATKLAYEASMVELDKEFSEQQLLSQQNYNSEIASATTAYSEKNETTTQSATESMSVVNYMSKKQDKSKTSTIKSKKKKNDDKNESVTFQPTVPTHPDESEIGKNFYQTQRALDKMFSEMKDRAAKKHEQETMKNLNWLLYKAPLLDLYEEEQARLNPPLEEPWRDTEIPDYNTELDQDWINTAEEIIIIDTICPPLPAANPRNRTKLQYVLDEDDQIVISDQFNVAGGTITFHAIKQGGSSQLPVTILFDPNPVSVYTDNIRFIQIAKNSSDKYWKLDGAKQIVGDGRDAQRIVKNPTWKCDQHNVNWPSFDSESGDYKRNNKKELIWGPTHPREHTNSYALMRDEPGIVISSFSGTTVDLITAVVFEDYNRETGQLTYTWLGYVKWSVQVYRFGEAFELKVEPGTGSMDDEISVTANISRRWDPTITMSVQELFHHVLGINNKSQDKRGARYLPQISLPKLPDRTNGLY